MATDTASKGATKDRVTEEIFRARDDVYALGDEIYRDPELGFKEHRTAGRVRAYFDRLGVEYLSGLAITGVKGVVDTGRPGPTVAILGELDSIVVYDHPDANPETGAAHCCGHNCQIAGMAAAATGLLRSGALEHLGGRLVFFAVPAEEYVEIDYRARLRAEGKLQFLGGKSELVALGEFDDVDVAIMMHSGNQDRERERFTLSTTSNGFVAKLVRYRGLAAHAAGGPDEAVNALNAALVGLTAIHANRETFADDDSVRVHPIITRGGDLVNVVPSDVRLETYVRGKTMEAVRRASDRVDRALRAGAMAVGAAVDIETIPGYLPQINDEGLNDLFRQNAVRHFGPDEVGVHGHRAGSSDVGDLQHLLPMIQPSMNGSTGTFHGSDYAIADRETSYLWNGVLMAETAIDLLWDDASEARRIRDGFTPAMTKAQYLQYLTEVSGTETFGEVDTPTSR